MSDYARIESGLCFVLMLLAAIAAACTLVALAQLDLGWALGLAALALASFEAALFVTSEGDTR